MYAARGLGCFDNGDAAHVSEREDLPGGYLTTCSFTDWDEAALLEVKRAGMELRTWGDGFGYLLVATGGLMRWSTRRRSFTISLRCL